MPTLVARSPLSGYAVAVGSVAAVTAFKLALRPVIGLDWPFFLLFGAVMVAAWYGGFRPGLVATLLGAAVGHVVFTPPAYSVLKPEWGRNLMPVVFAAEGTLISYLAEWLRRARAESRRAGEELRLLLDGTMNHALILLDGKGRVRHWNRGAERVTGHTAAEVVGRPFAHFYLSEADGPGRAAKVLGAATAAGRTEDEAWWRRADGSRFWAAAAVTALRDPAGRVSGFVLAVQDVTDRKLAEDALRQSELRLRLMADALPALIAYIDTDCRYQFNNATYERWLGIPVGECLERHVSEVIGPAAYDRVKDHIAAALRGEPQSYESRVTYPGGAARDVHVEYVPHRGPDGRVLGFYSLTLDITDRKRAEAALRASEERLRAIVTTAPDAIITLNRRGTIESVNPATERMFGYSAADLVGQNIGLFLPLPYLEGHGRSAEESARTSLRRLIKSGREVHALRKDGSTFPVELSVSETGSLGLFVGILRDVTRRLELEREVLEATGQEQRRIGQELHDHVGQELTGLQLLAATLAEKLPVTDPPLDAGLVPKFVAGLRRVHAEVRALARGLVPVEINPNGLRAALDNLAKRAAEQSGVRCLFGAIGSAQVGDAETATHLFRIAQEAVSNALRHSRAGTIWIALRTEPGLLIMHVRDDGVGIPDAPPEGAGLGLRLMEYRASLIGGTLTVTPGEGRGTQVTCWVTRSRGVPTIL